MPLTARSNTSLLEFTPVKPEDTSKTQPSRTCSLKKGTENSKVSLAEISPPPIFPYTCCQSRRGPWQGQHVKRWLHLHSWGGWHWDQWAGHLLESSQCFGWLWPPMPPAQDLCHHGEDGSHPRQWEGSKLPLGERKCSPLPWDQFHFVDI